MRKWDKIKIDIDPIYKKYSQTIEGYELLRELFSIKTETKKSSIKIKPTSVYKIPSVQIGDQTWTAKNLDVENYRNGDPIPQVSDPQEWAKLKTGAWCYYDNNHYNNNKYGKLYNWYAVNDPRGLCPEGWHIPSKVEFEELDVCVNRRAEALIDKSKKLNYNLKETQNATEFSALFAGRRSSYGSFALLGGSIIFWSSTEGSSSDACTMGLYDDNSNVSLYYYNKEYGFSVRCIKD